MLKGEIGAKPQVQRATCVVKPWSTQRPLRNPIYFPVDEIYRPYDRISFSTIPSPFYLLFKSTFIWVIKVLAKIAEWVAEGNYANNW